MIASTLLFCLSMLTSGAIADTIPKEEFVMVRRNDLPQFPGGIDSLNAFIKKRGRYPYRATEGNMQGTVSIVFIVRSDSSITDITLDGTDPGYGMKEEAIWLIKRMPKWKPALQGGRAVHCYRRLSFRFDLLHSSIVADEVPAEDILRYTDTPPYFPGGNEAYEAFIAGNLQYPPAAKALGVQGVVRIAYVLTPLRVMTNIHAVDTALGHGLEEEALRLVHLMPPMKGGTAGGRPVAIYDTLYIPFKLP